jgi:hypothetical protein
LNSRVYLLSFISLVSLLLSACEDTHVAGGGGMETGNGSSVTGVIAYGDGLPASGATITLRPKEYLETAMPGQTQKGQLLADAGGSFTFKGLDTGAYILEAAGTQSRGLILECHIDKPRSHTDVQGQLTPTGEIHGTISLTAIGTSQVFVQIYGLERRVVPDSSGAFIVKAVPEGNYTLRLGSTSATLRAVDFPKVHVRSALTEEMGTLDLPPKGCSTFVCDTLQVRALLDSNGLFSIGTAQISRTASSPLRITELRLTQLKLTVLPEGLGKLELLTLLDLSDNLLKSLPSSIGNLRALRSLDLFNNQLTGLPDEITKLPALASLNIKQNNLANLPSAIGRLRALAFLDMQTNLLTSLPAGIKSLGPLALALDGNHLCNLTPDLTAWILVNEPDYVPTSQVCP